MRYWIVTTEASPAEGGGIGTYVQEMSAALTANGDDVVVIAVDWTLTTPLEITDGPTRVVRFNPTSWTGTPTMGGVAAASLGASNVIRFLVGSLGSPDFLEFQDYGALVYFTVQRQLTFDTGFPRIPVVVRLHGPAFALRPYVDLARYALPGYWFGEMERFALEAADLVLSPSPAMDRRLAAEGVRARPARAHNPMRLPEQTGSARYDGDLVYFGRLGAIKGILELMEALERRAAAGHSDTVSIIGGDAAYSVRGSTMRDFLARRHTRLIDDGLVQLRGELPRSRALRAVETARAVFVPSRFESFGYAVLEAMALRRVVLTGNNGAPSDYLVDGVSGIVCDPTSPASIDDALERAIAMDDPGRAAMGERAAITARGLCDPDHAVTELRQALAALTPRRPGRTFPVVRSRERLATIEPGADSARPGLLSVVIPCYNLGAYVQEALDSVVASDHRPMEVLVVDDGSTDSATRDALEGLTVPDEADLELRVVRTTNQGLARTRNTGGQWAHGEFLAFLDADDEVEPSYFGRAIEIMRAYDNVGLVGCWLSSNGPQGWWETWNTELPYLLFQNTINSAGVVMRRDVFRAHGQNNPELFTGMEDYDSVLRMVAAGWHGVSIPERLFRYRVRMGSMMRGFNPDNRTLMYERIAAGVPDLLADHAIPLSGLLSANGPGWARANPTVSLAPSVRLRDS